jgi:hypothetical protein
MRLEIAFFDAQNFGVRSRGLHNLHAQPSRPNQEADAFTMFSRWARKGLHRGDLSTLSELAEGSGWGDPNPARLERLSFRGFVVKKSNDRLSVTLKGRAALWVRRHSR